MQKRREHYPDLNFNRSLLLGIGGEIIEELLYRIKNGGIPRRVSKVIVYIGTNNLALDDPQVLIDKLMVLFCASVLHGLLKKLYPENVVSIGYANLAHCIRHQKPYISSVRETGPEIGPDLGNIVVLKHMLQILRCNVFTWLDTKLG